MAEWLYEDGIGEERAALVRQGVIVAARVIWDDEPLRPGLVAEARLTAKTAGLARGTVRFADGSEALVDGLGREVCEGATLMVRIVRAAITERGRYKLPLARPAPETAACPAPGLFDELRAGSDRVRRLLPGDDALDAHGWDELLDQAQTGEIAFAGGSLTISPTPAMTLIDVDGALPPAALALAAVPTIAAALGRLDIGGSMGIDFPSLADRRGRQAVDAALAGALRGWRGERTAMNGFGLVQLVARLERPSLLARVQLRPAAAAARMLLRQAERVSPGGHLLLSGHPAVRAAMQPAWLDELARRSGRPVRWRDDAALALSGGFAQALRT